MLTQVFLESAPEILDKVDFTMILGQEDALVAY